MPSLIYKFPAVEFKTVATARIKLPSNDLYGPGFLPGSTVFKKLRGVYDVRAASNADLPRLVWTGKDAAPDDLESTTFHRAGVPFSITASIFSGFFETTDEVDMIADRLMQLFYRQSLVLPSFVTRGVTMDVIAVIEDPVGMQGIVQFDAIFQVA